jgi:hypothetical protein
MPSMAVHRVHVWEDTAMAGTLNSETKSPSRRALLAGVLGGIGAWAASTIGHTSQARAAVGDYLRVGYQVSGTGLTSITNPIDSGDIVFGAYATGGQAIHAESDSDVAVYGYSGAGAPEGILGASVDGTGMYGASGLVVAPPVKTGVFGYATQDASAVGVHGESVDGIGLLGLATGTGVAAFGLFARSDSPDAGAIGARSSSNATAIMAKSGTGSFPTAKAKTAVYGYAAQDSSARGLWGETTSGHAIHGTATSGYAGFFVGKVYTSKFHEMQEMTAPAAPGANKARLFLKASGSGKTQLCVRFSSGAIQVLATQP